MDDDIRHLYIFGVQTFGVDHAELYYGGLFEAYEFLARFALVVRLWPELRDETCAHPYKSHLIFYGSDGANVFIQTVRHFGENWKTNETF